MIHGRRYVRPFSAVLVVAIIGIGFSASAAYAKSAFVSPTRLHSLLEEAAAITSLPANTVPSISSAATATGQFVAVGAGCTGYANLTSSPIRKCTFGDKSAKHTIVLLGDSHATMWLPAFNLIGKERHFRIIDLWKASCGAVTLPFVPYLYSSRSSFPQCTQFLKWAIGEVNSLDPSLVVISEQDGDGSPPPGTTGGIVSASAWESGLAKTLGSIVSPNTQKFVLGDVDYLTQDSGGGPACLAAHESSIQRCSEPVAEATSSRYSGSDQAATSQAGAHYVDVIPWLCSKVCSAIVQKTLVFADPGHLTTQMTELVAGALEGALSASLGAALAQ
jgi:hypothetical protein